MVAMWYSVAVIGDKEDLDQSYDSRPRPSSPAIDGIDPIEFKTYVLFLTCCIGNS
jgi:hypothetical protein